VGRGHGRPARAKQQPLQQGGRLRAGVGSAGARAFLHDGMHPIPEVLVDDGVMFAGIGRALVDGLA